MPSAGIDNVTIANNVNSLAGIGGWTVDGGGNASTLTISDAGASQSQQFQLYQITNNQVNVGARTLVTYQSVGKLNLFTGAAITETEVASTSAATHLVGSVGSNIFLIGVTGNLDSVRDPVTVDGKGSANALTINDVVAPSSATYSINSGFVTKSFIAGVTYQGVQSLAIIGSIHGSVFNVGSTNVPTNLVGEGNDTFNIGNGNLDSVQGRVKVISYPNDAIVVNDSAAAFTGAYSVTGNSVTRAGFGGLVYNTADGINLGLPGRLTVRGANAGNVYNVTGTSVPTTLQGGAGNDTFNLGTSKLDALVGRVSVNGGAGADSVILNDKAATANTTYLIAADSVTRHGFGGLSYAAVASLALHGGSGKDVYNVLSTSAATSVDSSAGHNTFLLSAGTMSLASLAGPLTLKGSGVDTLVFFDTANPNNETYTFSGIPDQLLKLKTVPVSVAFTGMKSVFLQTNGQSTVIDPLLTIHVDSLF
jgi:hypothetical protein